MKGDPIYRCTAKNKDQKRCKNDATHEIAGHAMCRKHAESELEQRQIDRRQEREDRTGKAHH